ncbi:MULTISPECIES: DEAD/DEAH box helicase [unclassified Meiothermus]|uniref:DEAD/DEAH box helicase n=1 Tax=unclassified Meiothermus TaxID=370471 RepID=UPI000D7CEB60|nr:MULTISPECIES: DEAD/DEAH box helicase [unclassified Meiothermus]PZA08371.1 DEAD/DEAH box helicase [Meiothermus sp. Pnk-1]RYM36576.1 DEAD/DEAH box helicase [Meiothermus sp. PNK-Is4]
MLPPEISPHPSYADWLRSLEGYAGQLRFARTLPAKPPQKSAYRGEFAEVLKRLGFSPYAHQVEAFADIQSGRNLVAATSTASGKSLIFQVPVLKAALEGKSAILLYPTKALAHDQLARLQQMAAKLELEGTIFPYDGDTPDKQRRLAREKGRVILTNPDMLHFGLLPLHPEWAGFLGQLRYLVIDELHAYRGVFGTHVALILRRLLRLARHYGASPQIIAASATIANPAEHGENLTGEGFAQVSAALAKAEREFVVWVPKALDKKGQVRRSANLEAALLARYAAEAGLRALVFANSRRTAELVARYAGVPEVRPYRAGYTAAERRRLEASLRAGETKVLVSTSALELGVDIGELDMVVLLGYPGSLSAFWQRAGRAGRGNRRALVVWIPREDPLDEYYLERPELLLAGSAESAVADPENPVLYPLHLHCAARELPIHPTEAIYHPLLSAGLVQKGERLYSPKRSPHRELTLRGMGYTFTLKDAQGRVLGTLDERQAYWEAHPGAVYLHAGESYLVRNLDLERREIVLLPGLEEYYTQPRAETNLDALEGYEVLPGVWVGKVNLRERVTGYVKKRFVSETVLEEVALVMPELSFQTEAVWFHPNGEAPGLAEVLLPGAIHALEHAMIGLLPLFVLAERADVGGVSYPFYPRPLPSEGGATIFIYDGYPGGVGYAKAAARQFPRWIQATRDLLRSCPCEGERGCPRCTMSPKCGNGNQPLDKKSALALAEALTNRYARAAKPN